MEFVKSGELARRAGISRQTAFAFLKAQVQGGTLRAEGAGRAARYVRPPAPVERYRFLVSGLSEDTAWADVRARSAALRRVGPLAQATWDYAFTEMVNNAADHSGGRIIDVTLVPQPGALELTVRDDGEGVFQHLQRLLRLGSPREAAELLVKGKVTTLPERHSGQGLFFTSRAVDRFSLESGGLVLEVDATVDDWTLRSAPVSRGTCVTLRLAWDSRRSLKQVFDAYSDENFAFVRTSVHVRLFERAETFVSRSEGKRLCAGLERFSEAVLDFKGVKAVGQGFCDEVFRVWSRAHPGTRLVPINMEPDVRWFVQRALADAAALP